MTHIGIEALSLDLDGVAADTARAALDGLDAELARRLSLHAIDPSRLFAMASPVRLPRIADAASLGPDALRGRIAEALAGLLLSGAASGTPGGR